MKTLNHTGDISQGFPFQTELKAMHKVSESIRTNMEANGKNNLGGSGDAPPGKFCKLHVL